MSVVAVLDDHLFCFDVVAHLVVLQVHLAHFEPLSLPLFFSDAIAA